MHIQSLQGEVQHLPLSEIGELAGPLPVHLRVLKMLVAISRFVATMRRSGLLIFAVALAARLFYTCVQSKYCACSYGDSQYYLNGGLRWLSGTLSLGGAGQRLDGWPYMIVVGAAQSVL